jgi:hypothetical protein
MRACLRGVVGGQRAEGGGQRGLPAVRCGATYGPVFFFLLFHLSVSSFRGDSSSPYGILLTYPGNRRSPGAVDARSSAFLLLASHLVISPWSRGFSGERGAIVRNSRRCWRRIRAKGRSWTRWCRSRPATRR